MKWEQCVQFSMAAVVAGAVLTGCGSSATSSQSLESASEVASGNVAAAAVATESNGSYVAGLYGAAPVSYLGATPNLGGNLGGDLGDCRDLKEAADCNANDGVIQIALDLCKRGRAEWKGIEQLAFSSKAVCQARLQASGTPVSGSVVRTFLGVYGDDANLATYRLDGPRKWTYDTTTTYGYAEPVSGGTQVAFSLDATSQLPMRTVTIKGIRIVAEGTPQRSEGPCPEGREGKPPRKAGEADPEPGFGGHPPHSRDATDSSSGASGASTESEVKWDHSVSNDVAHPVQIVGTGKDKKILAGGVTKLQHNLMQFTSSTTIDADLTFAAGCCHPVGGQVSTVFTADKDGKQRNNEVLKFTAQCGVAELTASDGSQASVQLKGCF